MSCRLRRGGHSCSMSVNRDNCTTSEMKQRQRQFKSERTSLELGAAMPSALSHLVIQGDLAGSRLARRLKFFAAS